MAVVKRRIIWTTDEDWAALAAKAREADTSISRHITATLLATNGTAHGPVTRDDIKAVVSEMLAEAKSA